MGIEPTEGDSRRLPIGFEAREYHQALCASKSPETTDRDFTGAMVSVCSGILSSRRFDHNRFRFCSDLNQNSSDNVHINMTRCNA